MKKTILLSTLLCSSVLWAEVFNFEEPSGSKTFEQRIDVRLGTQETLGEIPRGVKELNVNLNSREDLDMQLYGEDGTAIISYSDGLLNGSDQDTVVYNGMTIKWSGYNGTNGEKGHEYIKITGTTTEILTMKVHGYKAGKANVDYSWGEQIRVASISNGKAYEGFRLKHRVIMSDVPSSAMTYTYKIEGSGNLPAIADVDFIALPKFFPDSNITVNSDDSTFTVPSGVSNFTLYINTRFNVDEYVGSKDFTITVDEINATGSIHNVDS